MVCSLALLVGIPSLLPVIFGPQNLDATATIFPFFNPNVVYFTISGTPINGIYLSTISVTVVVLVLLTILLRYTSLGLQMRGAVESRRLVQLDGVNANGVVARGLDHLQLHGEPGRRAPRTDLRCVPRRRTTSR